MASRLSPWGICRNLCVRSRPLLQTAEQQGRVAFPIARRGFADSTTTIQPGHESSAATSIPPPSIQPYKKELWADNFLNAEALAKLEQAASGEDALDEAALKFGMPPLPGRDDRLQNRYPSIIHQFTRLLMRDGKLSKAERVRLAP
jgi:small subunit ribosomal protein S7